MTKLCGRIVANRDDGQIKNIRASSAVVTFRLLSRASAEAFVFMD